MEECSKSLKESVQKEGVGCGTGPQPDVMSVEKRGK